MHDSQQQPFKVLLLKVLLWQLMWQLMVCCCLAPALLAAAGMALPLCLDRLVNVAVALVLSTTAIVLFGEYSAWLFSLCFTYRCVAVPQERMWGRGGGGGVSS